MNIGGLVIEIGAGRGLDLQESERPIDWYFERIPLGRQEQIVCAGK
jgi:hypothetical protein